MNDQTISRLSRKLSWLLRHGAGESDLGMDAAGWVPIDQLLQTLQVSRAHVDEVVEHNNKARFQIHEGRIRASQGHSAAGMPVTQTALEASWEHFDGDDSIWHGTQPKPLVSIAVEGLHPGKRTHVHLAATIDSVVGKRSNVGVMLEVSVAKLRAADIGVFVSPNGVVLARFVPPSCIVGMRTLSKRANKKQHELKALFGL